MSKFNFYEHLIKQAPFNVFKKENKYVISDNGQEFIINQSFIAYSNGNANNNQSFILELVKTTDTSHPFNIEIPIHSNKMSQLVEDSIDYLNVLFHPFDMSLLFDYLKKQTDIINQIEWQNKKKLLLNGRINIRLTKNKIEISEVEHLPFSANHLENKDNFVFFAVSAKTYKSAYFYMKQGSYESFFQQFKLHLVNEVHVQLSQGFIVGEKKILEEKIYQDNTKKNEIKNKI